MLKRHFYWRPYYIAARKNIKLNDKLLSDMDSAFHHLHDLHVVLILIQVDYFF